MGNSRARAVYEALLSDNFRRPQTDSALESFIRAKYEQKKYIAREWIPPPFPPKVDWDKEIDEELDNQKRKKKLAAAGTTISSIQEPPKPKTSTSSSNVIPAPLKPPSHSPKASRLSDVKKNLQSSEGSTDLLGLDYSSSNVSNVINAPISQKNLDNSTAETFDFFIGSAALASSSQQIKNEFPSNSNKTSLKQEEDDFFSQKSLDNGADKGKLTNDSILALYGKSSSAVPTFQAIQQPPAQIFNANFQQQEPTPFFFGAPTKTQNNIFVNENHKQQQILPVFNNGSNNNFVGVGATSTTMQSQQINRLNEENIRKIESLNLKNSQ